jgi:hypothetical protein
MPCLRKLGPGYRPFFILFGLSKLGPEVFDFRTVIVFCFPKGFFKSSSP